MLRRLRQINTQLQSLARLGVEHLLALALVSLGLELPRNTLFLFIAGKLKLLVQILNRDPVLHLLLEIKHRFLVPRLRSLREGRIQELRRRLHVTSVGGLELVRVRKVLSLIYIANTQLQGFPRTNRGASNGLRTSLSEFGAAPHSDLGQVVRGGHFVSLEPTLGFLVDVD